MKEPIKGSATTVQPPPSPQKATKQRSKLSVDMQAHAGLRGVCAIWIVVYHAFTEVVLQGPSLMPLFFCLSGFALTVTYGRTQWKDSGIFGCFRWWRQNTAAASEAQAHDEAAAAAAVEEGQAQAQAQAQAHAPPTTVTGAGRSPLPSPPTSFSSSLSAPPPQHEQAPPSPSLKPFPTASFYQNRLARVMPVYWFSILIAIPLWLINLGKFSPVSLHTFLPSLLTSIVGVTTLLSFLNDTFIAAISPPGWFVCTMCFFWLCFPKWITHTQTRTDAQLVGGIVWLFYLQIALMLGIYFVMPLFIAAQPFTTATQNPLSRWPLFLMGMYAGMLVLRYPATPVEKEKQTQKEQEMVVVVATATNGKGKNKNKNTKEEKQQQQQQQQQTDAAEADVPDLLPWPSCILGLPLPPFLTPTHTHLAGLIQPSPSTRRAWAQVATNQSLGLLFTTLLVAAGDTYVRKHTHGEHSLLAFVWFQAIVPMAQLNVILALTRDVNRSSKASRMLCTPWAEWLGKVSMNVYLIHYSLMYYLSLALNPKETRHLLDCSFFKLYRSSPEVYAACMHTMEKEVPVFPRWGVCVILPLALVCGEVLFRLVEEPARKALRSRGGG